MHTISWKDNKEEHGFQLMLYLWLLYKTISCHCHLVLIAGWWVERGDMWYSILTWQETWIAAGLIQAPQELVYPTSTIWLAPLLQNKGFKIHHTEGLWILPPGKMKFWEDCFACIMHILCSVHVRKKSYRVSAKSWSKIKVQVCPKKWRGWEGAQGCLKSV